jgi:hypothetical protein
MKECTWQTHRKQSLHSSLQQVKRLQYWDKQKATRLQSKQEYRQVLEVEECTLQPNPEKPVVSVKPTEIFNRNLEWL